MPGTTKYTHTASDHGTNPLQQYFQSTKSGWRRVSRRHPCPICGKTDWCGLTADEHFAVCMRESHGALGETRHGGFIHSLSADLAHAATGKKLKALRKLTAPAPSPEQEPDELHRIRRDIVYRTLIELSPATLAPAELIYAPDGLAPRRLRDTAASYGMLPGAFADRVVLARELIAEIKRQFPALVHHALRPYNLLAGVPGFWSAEDGICALWQPEDHPGPVLVVPYRDARSRVQGCQLRSPSAGGQRWRYQWLSSATYEEQGASPGTPIHLVNYLPQGGPATRPVIITEGALKADACGRFLKEQVIIATSGVACAHAEIIAAACRISQGKEIVRIAFDSDHRTNKTVCRQIARLAAGLEAAGCLTHILLWTTTTKGLDDALLARARDQHMQFHTLSPQQWLEHLPEELSFAGELRQ